MSAAPPGSETGLASPPATATAERWASLRGRAAPIDIARLPDAALVSCRLRTEWLALLVAIVLLVVLLGMPFLFDFHPAELGAVGFATAWLADTALKLLVLPRQVGGAIEITATQLDNLYPVVQELRERFDLPAVRVFVSFENDVPAGAYGLWPPYSIRIHSLVVASLNAEEFRFLLGREMGAIRLNHQRLALIFGAQSPVLATTLQWILFPRLLIFAWWYRSQELSRDRAGLLACRSVRVALTTLVNLNARPLGARVSMDALEPQVQEIAHGRRRWTERLVTLVLREPLLMRRIRCLVEWAGPPEPTPAAAAG